MSNVVRVNNSPTVGRIVFSPKTVSSQLRGVEPLDTSQFKYNQSPVETPDGSNKAFTLPSSDSFITGLLEVFVDGVQKTYTRTSATVITLAFAPDADEAITINYIAVAT